MWHDNTHGVIRYTPEKVWKTVIFYIRIILNGIHITSLERLMLLNLKEKHTSLIKVHVTKHKNKTASKHVHYKSLFISHSNATKALTPCVYCTALGRS